MMLGLNPQEIPMRLALRYNQHSEALWEHRADIIAYGVGKAFGGNQ